MHTGSEMDIIDSIQQYAGRYEDSTASIGRKVCNVSLQARALIDDIGMDNVTIHLDTYHMNIEENSMEQAVKDAEDKLG